MQGHHVVRKAGWDCHGLPVETRRREGARLHRQGRHRGVRRRRVQRQVPRVGAAPRRRVRGDDRADGLLGRHLDQAYRTMDPAYVESVWWSLKQIFDKGLLVQDHRVAPYCPRCGTGLSDHELAQGYETVVDPSVYVRLPADQRPVRRHTAALLVWTTTPWTLVSNTAVAVHPDVTYVTARTDGEPRRWSSPSRWSTRSSARAGRSRTAFTGRGDGALDLPAPVRPGRLAGRRRPGTTTWCSPTTSPPRTAPGWCTRRPRSAPTTSRSAAPTACRWSTRCGPTATSTRPCRWSAACSSRRRQGAGRRPRRARPAVPAPGLRAHATRTAGAATPRCSTTRSRPGTSAPPRSRTRCCAENEQTNWFPENIKWGRYGDWLHNNIDWALSRVALLGHAAADLAVRRRRRT